MLRCTLVAPRRRHNHAPSNTPVCIPYQPTSTSTFNVQHLTITDRSERRPAHKPRRGRGAAARLGRCGWYVNRECGAVRRSSGTLSGCLRPEGCGPLLVLLVLLVLFSTGPNLTTNNEDPEPHLLSLSLSPFSRRFPLPLPAPSRRPCVLNQRPNVPGSTQEDPIVLQALRRGNGEEWLEARRNSVWCTVRLAVRSAAQRSTTTLSVLRIRVQVASVCVAAVRWCAVGPTSAVLKRERERERERDLACLLRDLQH